MERAQRMPGKRLRNSGHVLWAFLLVCMLACVTGCVSVQVNDAGQVSSSSGSDEGQPKDEVQESYQNALEGKGVVSTFIGEKVYDGKITNGDEATAVVRGLIDRIGGDQTTKLELVVVRPTEDKTTYYIFRQRAGDVLVFGASVKLIVSKDGEATGLVSSILPNVKAPDLETWAASQEQAEEAVRKHMTDEGVKGVEILSKASEQTIIPLVGEGRNSQYAWVVYTKNYYDNAEMAYLAHYVNEDGEYLYAIPVVEPNNAEALSGDTVAYDFNKYEQAEDTFQATLHDGKTKKITVPVQKDPESNSIVLADSKRKILCADYAEYANNDKLVPSSSQDNSFDNVDLLAYDTFVRVWDFFDSVGWTGPDSEGTPTLLLMNYVDENGEQADEAAYLGKQNGFQVFTFNRVNPDGENTDIIAHEFTHCITGTTMTTSMYMNDSGAINEGMSDVMGNLVEMLIEDRPEGAWIMGEGSGAERAIRSMKDPHAFNQPEFAWDAYYVPSVLQASVVNDSGGVHIKSSLLNIVSYKLDKAGMKPEQQQYFWMNVALAMTPLTDYPQMAELLPWSMRQVGYDEFVEPLNKAIAEAKYTVTKNPGTLVAGTGTVSVEFSQKELAEQGAVNFALVPKTGNGDFITWPPIGSNVATSMAPPGDYVAAVD